MTRDGLLETRTGPGSRSPDRRILSLTASGRRLAESWLAGPGPADELAVRVAVARVVIPDRLASLLDGMIEQRLAELHQLREMRDGSGPTYQAEAITLEMRRAEADIRWLETLRERVGEVVSMPGAGAGLGEAEAPAKEANHAEPA